MIRLDKVYQNVFGDKFEVLPLLNTTRQEFGRERAILKGKKRITDKIIDSFATPEYAWAIRSLLEDEKYETFEELYKDFDYYLSIATIDDAKSYLLTGFYFSATNRIDNTVNKPLIFAEDEDFKATRLYLNDLPKKLDLFKEYFEKKNNGIKDNYSFGFLKKKLLKLELNDDDSIAVLWGVKIGEIDAYEELITDKRDRIEAAKRWAIENNFDRLRVAYYQKNDLPDFLKAI